jgi:DNA-binding transcriptional regulator YiaG
VWVRSDVVLSKEELEMLQVSVAKTLSQMCVLCSAEEFVFLRKVLGLTRETLSLLFGVDVSLITQYETKDMRTVKYKDIMSSFLKYVVRQALSVEMVQDREGKKEMYVYVKQGEEWVLE